MIYSCFDAKSGFYDYFETDEQIAVNADLPVPSFPAPVNGIGVASIEAARPIPSDARRVGSGWHARGIVANCARVGTSGVGQVDDSSGLIVNLLVFGAAAMVALWAVRRWEAR
jgi:hypothetical protein